MTEKFAQMDGINMPPPLGQKSRPGRHACYTALVCCSVAGDHLQETNYIAGDATQRQLAGSVAPGDGEEEEEESSCQAGEFMTLQLYQRHRF